MNYRLANILAEESIDTAATKTLDINLADPISRIVIQAKGTNSSGVPTAHPAKMISKIELVDGSDVIFSLSGVEAQALNFHNSGKMPHTVLNYVNDVSVIATYHLDFGRFLYDPLLALDPRKFVNPQLRITHNKALGGSAPDAGKLYCYAHIFDDKEVSPEGFLMSKEQYSFSITASATEHIDLSVDHPYRVLMIMSMAAALQPWQQFNTVKLDQDNGRRIIINGEKTSDLLKLFAQWPSFSENIIATMKNGTTVAFCSASYNREGVLVGVGADADAYITETWGGSISMTDGAACTVTCVVDGEAPHGSLAIPFGMQGDPADWFDVSEVGSLKLDLAASADGSGTTEIVSQQLRKY